MSKLEDFKATKKKLAKVIADARKEAGKIFKEEIKNLFVKHPKLKSIRWAQYTPYFNDGDTCEFGVYNEDPTIVFDGIEYEDAGLWAISDAKQTIKEKRFFDDDDQDHENRCRKIAENKELQAAIKDVVEFLTTFDEEDYLELFGDHVEVTVTKNKISKKDYEHD